MIRREIDEGKSCLLIKLLDPRPRENSLIRGVTTRSGKKTPDMSSQSPKSCQDKTIHSPSPSTKFSKPNLCPSPEGKDNQSDLPSQVIESPYSSSSEERNDEYDIIEITHPGPDSIPHSNFDKSSHSPNLIGPPMEKGSSTLKDASDDETPEVDLPLWEID
jgi:hypothetical protein